MKRFSPSPMQRSVRGIVAALVVGAHCTGAMARDAPLPILAPGAYVSGGIGDEDRQRMQESRDLYNLRLAFAEAGTGAYIAGVELTIESVGTGQTYGPFADCGPLFHVALKPGAYRVRATYAGTVRTMDVQIGKGATSATLYWPIIPG